MTHKNERKCWNCGSRNLQPDGRGVRCKDCGATWNPLPKLEGEAYVQETSMVGTPKRKVRFVHNRPSDSVLRSAAAAQARGKKETRPE